MYLEEKFKAEIVAEALEKSGEAVSPNGDGQEGSRTARRVHSDCLRGVSHQRVLLSLRLQA